MNNAWSDRWAVLGAILILLGIAVYFDWIPEPGIEANAVDFSAAPIFNDERRADGDKRPHHRKHDGKHHRGSKKHDDRNLSFSLTPLETSAKLMAQPNTLSRETLIHDGIERTFSIYAPSTLEAGAPLVFLLHGGGGDIETSWEQEYGRNFRALSDQHGFLLVLPQGREDLDSPGDHHWNDCRTDIANLNVNTQLDDVGFISAVIDEMEARFDIDLNRVYVTGASNGGMMSYRLAMELGHRFAAIGALIANLPDPSECSLPDSPISMLIMNGTDDPLMNYDGGCVANATCRRGNVMSTDDTVNFWTALNQTEADPTIEELPDRVSQDRSTVTKFTYAGGMNNTQVLLYRINNGGHTVPGDEPLGFVARITIGEKNLDINGPEEIWAFFEQHVR